LAKGSAAIAQLGPPHAQALIRGTTLALRVAMPRTTKDSQFREDEEIDREDAEAPRVDENEIEPEDRAQSKLDEEAAEQRLDDDDIVEEIDLDELSAMEGPDA
jgi:hypothetical protein